MDWKDFFRSYSCSCMGAAGRHVKYEILSPIQILLRAPEQSLKCHSLTSPTAPSRKQCIIKIALFYLLPKLS